MRRLAKALMLVVLLTALPLRGYAGVLMALCEANHGGAAVGMDHVHENDDSHHQDSDSRPASSSHAASVCSVCASCCASAGLAPDASCVVAFGAPEADRIPFRYHQVSGFVPEHLDRPPLAS